MNWGILGIDPTSDKKLITQAYRAALVNVNPEDKPEEFKALRAAYEEALELAKKAQSASEETEPATPIDAWIQSISKLYSDFPTRLSSDAWKSVLQDDVCVALDTRPAAEEALLVFLMDNCRLSWDVWKVLGEEFSWIERVDELKEKFPGDFVDYVLVNGVLYGEFLPLSLFTPGLNAADCDEYVMLFTRARRETRDEVGLLMQQMEALSESHPYGRALACFVASHDGDRSVIDELDELWQAYPQHGYVVGTVAQAFYELGEYERGQQVCRAFLEHEPDNKNIPYILARCIAGAGDYAAAVEILNDLMAHAGGDDILLNDLSNLRSEWNESLIVQYEQAVNDNPQDSDARFELAWCYLQNDRVEEAWDMVQPVNADDMDAFAYYNLVSQIHFASRRYEEALEGNDAVLEALLSYGEGADDQQKRRVARIPEKLMLRATLLNLLGRSDEALQESEAALALAPDDPGQLNRVARFCLMAHDYQRARDHAFHLTEVLPNGYHGYLTLAYAAYGLRDDREAFEAVNRAIDEDGTDLSEYSLKLQILIRNGAFEEARALIDFLKEHGAGDAPGVRFAEGQLAEFEEKDSQKALALYEEAVQAIEDGVYVYEPGAVFFRWAVVLGDLLNTDQHENAQRVLDVLERGLALEIDNLMCLDYKVWLLKKMGRNREALDTLLVMEKDPSHDGDVERELAEMYRKNLKHAADKALHYYQLLLQDEPENAVYLFYAGVCLLRLNRYEEAVEVFLREEKVEPDCVDPHRGLYDAYLALGKYHDAMWHIDECIKICANEGKSPEIHMRSRVKTLRRMGLPLDAVATAIDLDKRCSIDTRHLIFDIYAQFGMFDQAKKHVKEWLKDHASASGACFTRVLLHCMQGNYTRARLEFFDKKAVMGFDDMSEALALLNSLSGNYGTEIAKQQEALDKHADADNDSLSHIYLNLSLAYWRADNQEMARKIAQLGVSECDEALSEFSTYRPLFLTRKAIMLALLGSFEESDACLSEARSIPLCSHCPYCACKDADLFETYILSLKGLHADSLSACAKYLEKWPDETDLHVQKRYAEKRV